MNGTLRWLRFKLLAWSLTSDLGSDSLQARQEAMRLFAHQRRKKPKRQAFPLLRQLIEDPNGDAVVRNYAVLAVMSFMRPGDTEAAQVISQTLLGGRYNGIGKMQFAAALGRVGGKVLVDTIMQLGRNAELSTVIMMGLNWSGDPCPAYRAREFCEHLRNLRAVGLDAVDIAVYFVPKLEFDSSNVAEVLPFLAALLAELSEIREFDAEFDPVGSLLSVMTAAAELHSVGRQNDLLRLSRGGSQRR